MKILEIRDKSLMRSLIICKERNPERSLDLSVQCLLELRFSIEVFDLNVILLSSTDSLPLSFLLVLKNLQVPRKAKQDVNIFYFD